jgi:hypothetical protein
MCEFDIVIDLTLQALHVMSQLFMSMLMRKSC